MTATSVIVAGARTPVGRLQGALKDFSAADLGAHAIKAALERAGVAGDQVQYVILGQVLQAGAGQIPSRQAAVIEALRRGKANKIIAYELNMRESTVKVHVRNIMKKLKATNRTEVAYIANEMMPIDRHLNGA